MVHAGERHIDVLQVRAGADDLALQRHIGDHDHIGVLGLLDLHLGVGVLGVGLEAVAGVGQRLGAGIQHGIRYAEGFEQNDIHSGKDLLDLIAFSA